MDSDDAAASAARFEGALQRRMALIVEAQTMDDGALSLEAENARGRIARSWARRHGSDFGKTDAHGEHGVGHFAVLVETCRDAEGIWEWQAEEIDAERGGTGFALTGAEPRFQRRDGEAVGAFGIDEAEGRAGEREEVHAC